MYCKNKCNLRNYFSAFHKEVLLCRQIDMGALQYIESLNSDYPALPVSLNYEAALFVSGENCCFRCGLAGDDGW